MLGIPRFISQKLKYGTKYKHSIPVAITYKNKVFIHGRTIENIENYRRYSTHSFYTFKSFPPTLKCASSLSTDVSQIPIKKRSRIWKYLLGLGGVLVGFFFYYTTEDDDDDKHTDSGLPIPSKASEVTKEWIESIFSEYESRNSEGAKVKVKSFEVGNALEKGEGLNSQLLKLDVHASVENIPGSVPYDKEYHVMIKMPERSKPLIQAMNKFIAAELKELTIYSQVIQELNTFQEAYGNEFRIKVPEFIYGKYKNKDSILVMENAKYRGYIPHSSKFETDLNHAKIVIENLANLHAVSYAYNKTHNFADNYPCYKQDGLMNRFFCLFNTNALLDSLIQILLLKNDDYCKALAVKIEKSKASLDNKVRNVINDNESKTMMCLTHADSHNSNFLFKYVDTKDGNKIIDDFQFIDWQFSHWNSPIIDLQTFVNVCTSHEFRKTHLETLLKHYHTIFTKATSRMGTPASHWTYEEFIKEYERLASYGLMRCILLRQVIHSKLFEVYQQGALEESTKSSSRIDVMNAKLCELYWNKQFTSPAFEKFTLSTMSVLMIYLIRREIVSESNPILNDGIFGLILDADEQGIFDDSEGERSQA